MLESTRRRSSARQRRYLEFHADSEMHRRALPCGHEVNQLSVLFGIQAVMETVRQAGGSSIINTSSTAGITGAPTSIAYVAAK
jgi:NADP-dependent 3-hydroxy acid dehydrogenase YdfG